MMGSDLVARQRISELMSDAEAERLARPLIEARRRARRERFSARAAAIRAAFSRRRSRSAERLVEA
jgi:hypothetical protein